MRNILAIVLTILLVSITAALAKSVPMAQAHDFTLTAIDGEKMPLKQWQGKPILVVNTASFCGYTHQYAGLQKLWETYRDRGLIVLGVPSNDFGRQEPGSAKEIKHFCEVNFDVDFPLTEKMKVSGGNASAFYHMLRNRLGDQSVPRWNFHKYLINGDGIPVAFWPSAVAPMSDRIRKAVEAEL